MALKPITRQEQIIVGKNLEPITRMERFLKEYGGGSGGGTQSDWNQTDSSAADFINNKPFGDMPTGGDTLYWDGNTEGMVCFLDVYYKVSDATPSMGDFANGFVLNGAQQVPEFLTALGDGAFIHADGFFVVVPEDNMEINGEVIPSKGVYFLSNPGGGAVASSLTIPGYTGFPVTKKMEEKYLPDTAVQNGDKELVLTSPSGNVFSITVSDDGTLTATEQTAS